MDDVKLLLAELKQDLNSGRLQVKPAALKRVSPLRLAGVVVAVVVLIAASWYWLGRQGPTEPEAPLTAVPLTSYLGYERSPSFSPDGNYVAFQWRPEGSGTNYDIYIKQIGEEPPAPLTADPADDISPTWSPDGLSIAFLRRSSPSRVALMLKPPQGGREQVLEELELPTRIQAPHPYLSWTPDSKWLVYPSARPGKEEKGLLLISVETLEKRRLTTSRFFDTTPAFSPDGRTLAFTRWNPTRPGIRLLHLGANYEPQGEPPVLVTPEEEPSFGMAWTPDGSDIVSCSGTYAGAYAARGLWRMAASMSAKPMKLAFASDATSAPAISRRGNRLAYEVMKTDANVYRVDLNGPGRKPGIPFKFITSTRREVSPAYSPDGKKISFSSDRSGSWEIWVCDRDGSNAFPLTSLGGEYFARPAWSPDSRSIAFGLTVRGKNQVFITNANSGISRLLATEPSNTRTWPSWSWDGQWIYFRSGRTRSSEIWKMRAGGGEAVQVTHNGGDLPEESPDGKLLYYLKADQYPEQCSVWRMPTGGGEETRVLDSTACLGPFAVGEQGVYFITPLDEQGHRNINLYGFSSGKARPILTVESRAMWMAVSPDDRTILYSHNDQTGSDLMLVENFR